ncbi:site-specific integrase [Halobacterium sp. CBA1126]|uniref:tyrosine-type recombinase/integrase n=1 Tax=Halobacterium TaxID=2239 RepID=UPI0012FB808D|nr:site-specific integrase [Halobacterium sp. CBA1126]MUV59764.1 tyrosine-type recombinase/integrase [Halobacterium sp. CBA1126]
MRLKDYDERDGKRVWLSERELQHLIDNRDDDHPEMRAAFLLGARCGLRRNEIVDVTAQHLVTTDHGRVVRVWEGKGDKYREVPCPDALADVALGMSRDPGDPLVSVDDSTIYDWVQRSAQRCRAETGDEGWQFVGPHDLRRSWGIRALESGVLPSVVMEWGGWNDWETFRKHYLAEFSPEALRRERGKVSWLGGHESSENESYAVIGRSAPASSGRNPHS